MEVDGSSVRAWAYGGLGEPHIAFHDVLVAVKISVYQRNKDNSPTLVREFDTVDSARILRAPTWLGFMLATEDKPDRLLVITGGRR